MPGFWSNVWDGICNFARSCWNLMCNILSAAIEFFGEAMDFIFGLFDSLIDLMMDGLARLYILVFPPREECHDQSQKDLIDMMQGVLDGQGKDPDTFSFAVKTNRNKQVQEVKGFHNSNADPMGGLYHKVRNKGIVEVTC